MKQFSQNEVKESITHAIGCFLKNDLCLLQNDVNERSISHKLAEYLQTAFPDWHVDCEYNRDFDHIKRLSYPLPSEPIDSLKARTIYPDIVIHRRNTNQNLVVIEIKKESNIEGDDETKDKNKITAFLELPYRYQFGLFVAFTNEGTPRLDWICNSDSNTNT